MGRRPPCCDKSHVKKGPWTAEEDAKIRAYVASYGIGNWTLVPQKADLNRCWKSCKLRWMNYLRPDLKHDSFTPHEEELILRFHQAIGSRWSLIAKKLPGRTYIDVKNHWNIKLKQKLTKMGIDPSTHKPFALKFSDLAPETPKRIDTVFGFKDSERTFKARIHDSIENSEVQGSGFRRPFAKTTILEEKARDYDMLKKEWVLLQSTHADEIHELLEKAKKDVAFTMLQARVKMVQEANDPSFDKSKWDVAKWKRLIADLEDDEGLQADKGEGSGVDKAAEDLEVGKEAEEVVTQSNDGYKYKA